MIRLLAACVACVALLLGAPRGRAADWPQFLGPTRNGHSTETGLLRTFPKNGPPVVWKKEVGDGFSGPVVAGDRLLIFHRKGDKDFVECLDPATGKNKWTFSYATEYVDRLGKGNGPRSTPLIAGNRVYALAADGRLHCLELETGKKVWMRSLNEDYGVPQGFFGVATSPIVEGNIVVINVGGKRKGAGVVALNKDTGKEVWKSLDDEASYSSPVAATIDDKRYLIFFTRTGLRLLDPKTGEAKLRKRWRPRYDASVNAAAPVVVGDEVFVSTCYETGGLLVKVKKDALQEVWSNDESLSAHYSTPAYHDGHLYGFHGRQEEGTQFRCVEWKTGKVRWSKGGFGCGSIIDADGRLIVLSEGGDLVLVEPTPEGYREKSRASVLDGPIRAHPALAGGRLFARDSGKLVCWDLKK